MDIVLGGGRLEDHPFAELAGLIFRGGVSGELVLDAGQRRRSVWFLAGNPVAVVSRDPQDHLAHFLLEQGKIGAEDARLLAEMPETREALGKAEFLGKETLTWGVKYRFVNLCYDLFRWDEGDYSFHEGDPPRQLFLLKVPTHALIFKGVGFVGQATIIEAVPDDAVCAAGPVEPAGASYLGPDLHGFLDDCRPGRTVGDVLAGRGEEVLPSRRLLYALSCLGLVAFSPPAAAAAAPFASHEEEAAETPGRPIDTVQAESTGALPPRPDEGASALAGSASRQARPEFEPAAPGSESEAFETPGLAPGPESRSLDLDHRDEAFGAPEKTFVPEHRDEPPVWSEESPEKEPKSASEPPGRGLRLYRISGIAIGTLAAVGLVVVAWWWMNSAEPPPPPAQPPSRPASSMPSPPATAPVSAPPATPAPAPSSPAGAGAPPAPGPGPTPLAATAKAHPSPSAPQPPVTPPAAATKQPPPQSPSKAAPSTPSRAAQPPGETRGNERYQTAFAVFKAGDFDGAAAMWEAQLAEQRNAFTIVLMTACSGETVRNAQRAFAPQQIYLIAKKVGGRNCFRVCLGTYDTREEADRALTGLPDRYRSEGAAVRSVANALGTGR